MVTDNDFYWHVVPNTVTERIQNNSLEHKLSSKVKVSKSTKLFNQKFKDFYKIRKYKDFVKQKKKILKRVAENEDVTDDREYDDDNDSVYENFYNVTLPSCVNTKVESDDENDECFQWIHVEKKGLKEYKDEDYLIESPKSDTRFSEPISSTFAGDDCGVTIDNYDNENVIKDISKKSDKAKKEIVSKKLPSNVKRNLATELDTASSKFLTEEEDESSDEFIPRDFQAQSTKIFSDTLSENIHNRKSLVLKPPLDVPKELNQPKDSGIDEDVADDNAKYKTVDKKLKSTENKIDNNQPKREIIGRDGPIKVPSKNPLKIIGEEKLSKRYKIVENNDRNKILKEKTNVFEVAGKSLYDLVDEKSESYKNNDEKYTKSLNAVNKKSSIQDNSDESNGLHNFEKISSDKDKTTKNQCLKNMEKLQQFKKMLEESKSPLLQQQYDTLVQNKLIKENSTKGSESDSNMNAESFKKSEKLTQVLKTQSKKVKKNEISASDNISTSENSDEKHGRDEVGDHHTQVDVDSMSPKTRINKEMNLHPKELIVSEKNSLIHKTHVTDDSSNDSIDSDHNDVSLKTIENLQKAKKLNLWDISESEIGVSNERQSLVLGGTKIKKKKYIKKTTVSKNYGSSSEESDNKSSKKNIVPRLKKRISRESSVSDTSKISDANKNGDDSDIEQHASRLPILCGISSNNPAKETVVVANGFSQDMNLNNFIDKSDENDDEKNYEKEFINKDSVKPSSSRNGCMNGNNYVSTSESKKLLQHENSSSSDDGIRPNKAKEDKKKRAMHDLQSQKSNVSTINNGRSRSLDKSVLTQKSADKSDSDSDSDLSNVSKSKIPVPLATSTQVHKSPTKQKLEHCAGKHDTKRNDCIVNSKNSYEQRGEIDIMKKSGNKSDNDDNDQSTSSSSSSSGADKILRRKRLSLAKHSINSTKDKTDNEKSPMNDSRSKKPSSSKKSNECKIKEKITPTKKQQRYDSYSDSDESDTPKSKTPEQMNQSVGMDVTKKLDDTSDSDSDSDSDKSKSTCASKRPSQYRNLSLLDKSLSSNEDNEDDKKQTVHDAESDDSSVSKSSNASKTSEKNTSKIQPHFSDSSSDKSFILTLSKSNNPIQDTSTQSKPSKSPVKKTSEQSRESLTINDKDSRKQSGTTDSIKEIQNIESEEMFPSSEKISLTEKRNGVNKASTAASESGKSSETEDEEIPLNQEQLKRKKITKISELVERDHLSEGICTSTVSLQDFSSDDHEIFLLDVPKYVFDKNLKNKPFSFSKTTLTLGDDKYEAFQKYASPTLSCLFKTSDKSKTAFKAFNIRPVASIVARRKKSSVNEDQDVTIETSKLSLNENDLENNKCTTDVSRLTKSPSVTKAQISKKHSKEVLSVTEEKNNKNVDDSSSSESQISLLNDVSRHKNSPSVTKTQISKKHSKEVLSVAEEKNNKNVDDSSSSESQISLLNDVSRHKNSPSVTKAKISKKNIKEVLSVAEEKNNENVDDSSSSESQISLLNDVSRHTNSPSVTKAKISKKHSKEVLSAAEEKNNENVDDSSSSESQISLLNDVSRHTNSPSVTKAKISKKHSKEVLSAAEEKNNENVDDSSSSESQISLLNDVSRHKNSPSVTKTQISKKHSKEVLSVAEEKNNKNVDDSSSSESQISLLNDVSRHTNFPSVTKAKISKKHSKEVLSVAEEKNNENVDDSSSSESQTSLLNNNVDPKDDECMARNLNHQNSVLKQSEISGKSYEQVISAIEKEHHENDSQISDGRTKSYLSFDVNGNSKNSHHSELELKGRKSITKLEIFGESNKQKIFNAIEEACNKNEVLKITVVIEKIEKSKESSKENIIEFDQEKNDKIESTTEKSKILKLSQSNKKPIMNGKVTKTVQKSKHLKNKFAISNFTKKKLPKKKINLALENNLVEIPAEKESKVNEEKTKVHLSETKPKEIEGSRAVDTVMETINAVSVVANNTLDNLDPIADCTEKKEEKYEGMPGTETNNNNDEIKKKKQKSSNLIKKDEVKNVKKSKSVKNKFTIDNFLKKEHSKKKNTDLPSKNNLVLTSPVSKNPKVEENKLKGNLSDSEQDKIGFRTTDTVTETINAVSVVTNNMLNSSDSIADFNEEKEEKVEVMKETETNIHSKEKTKKKSQKKLFNLHKDNQELVELTADNVKLDKKKEKKNLKLENLKSRDNDGSSVNNDGSSETKKRLQQTKKLSLLTNDSENGHSDSEKNRCVDSDKREKKAKNSEKKLELKNIESSEEEHAKSNEDVQNLITNRKSKKNLTTDNNKASNVHENIRDSDTNTKKHEINVPDENAKFNLIKKSKEKTLSLRPHHQIQNLPSSDDDANVPLKTVECLQKVKKLNLLDSSDSHDDQHNVEKKKVDKKKRKKKEKTEKTELNRETPIDIQESKNRKNEENPSAVSSVASNGQENTCDSDIDIKEHKIYLPEECKRLDLMKSYEEETLKPVEENKSKSKKHTSKKSNEVTEKEKNRCILNTSSESEVVTKKLSKKKSKPEQLKHVSFDIKSDDESDEKSMIIELGNPSMKTASNNINEDTSDHFMSVTAAQKLSKLKKLNLIDASSSSSEDEKYDRKSRTNDIVYNSKKSNVPNKNTLVQKQMPESSTEKKKLSSKCTSSLNINVNNTKKSKKTEKIQELVDRLDEDDAKLKRKKEKKKSSSTKNNVDSDTIVSNVQKKEEIQLVAEVINVDDFKIEKKKRKKKSRHDLDSAAISNEHEENRVEERQNVVDESNEDYVKVEKKKEKKKKAVDVNCDDKKLKRKREAEEEPVVEKKKLKKAKTNSEEKFKSKVEVDEPELVTFEVPCKKEKSKSNSEEAIEAPTPKKKKKAKTSCIDLEDEIKPSAKDVNEESTKTKEKQKKPAKTKKSSGDNVNQGSLGAEAAKPSRRLLALYESSSSDEYHKSSIKRAMDPDKEPKLESDSSDRKKKKKKKKHKSFHFDE